MIGSLRGTVLHIEGLCALIECANGVGYEVEVPASDLGSLQPGEVCFLYIHQILREDASLLYGFSSRESRLLFRELLKINGIGGKAALALLSTFSLSEFITIIQQKRTNALVTAPGIGKKTAERILVEMQDRLDHLRLEDQAMIRSTVDKQEISATEPSNAFACDDAVAALLSLGYKENIAMSAVKKAYQDDMDTETLIVQALALLSKK